jgi:phosphoribosylamine---glycine ligase
MKVLIVGGDGRAHALAWALERSPSVDSVVCAPGNPGTALVGENVPVGLDDLEGLAQLAVELEADLTVVSPEAPLVAGITDVFAGRGLRVFGPSKAAAEIEGSKVFCRDLALRLDVPVARGESFDDPDAATDFAGTISPPIVVKADGLAAGKGVLICRDHAEAKAAVDSIMRERVFGASGGRVIVEEFLEGPETSIFCVTDGEAKVVLEPAQDYKRALDGDEGLNTGGMGSYTPVPWLAPEVRQDALDRIVFPIIDGLREQGRPFVGCVYAGLMITDKGPYLIEINCRFGDPEIQALLPRLASDFGVLLDAAVSGGLSDQRLEWRDEACVCVCTASGGYPESYETGKPITGIDEAEALDGVVAFQAGTKLSGGELRSAGGRVLNVSALGGTISQARAKAYEAVGKIDMEGTHYRTDIAKGVS